MNFIRILLDMCKWNTPDAIVIHGPASHCRRPWNAAAKRLHDDLVSQGWHAEEKLGAVHLRTPWLPEA